MRHEASDISSDSSDTFEELDHFQDVFGSYRCFLLVDVQLVYLPAVLC